MKSTFMIAGIGLSLLTISYQSENDENLSVKFSAILGLFACFTNEGKSCGHHSISSNSIMGSIYESINESSGTPLKTSWNNKPSTSTIILPMMLYIK